MSETQAQSQGPTLGGSRIVGKNVNIVNLPPPHLNGATPNNFSLILSSSPILSNNSFSGKSYLFEGTGNNSTNPNSNHNNIPAGRLRVATIYTNDKAGSFSSSNSSNSSVASTGSNSNSFSSLAKHSPPINIANPNNNNNNLNNNLNDSFFSLSRPRLSPSSLSIARSFPSLRSSVANGPGVVHIYPNNSNTPSPLPPPSPEQINTSNSNKSDTDDDLNDSLVAHIISTSYRQTSRLLTALNNNNNNNNTNSTMTHSPENSSNLNVNNNINSNNNTNKSSSSHRVEHSTILQNLKESHSKDNNVNPSNTPTNKGNNNCGMNPVVVEVHEINLSNSSYKSLPSNIIMELSSSLPRRSVLELQFQDNDNQPRTPAQIQAIVQQEYQRRATVALSKSHVEKNSFLSKSFQAEQKPLDTKINKDSQANKDSSKQNKVDEKTLSEITKKGDMSFVPPVNFAQTHPHRSSIVDGEEALFANESKSIATQSTEVKTENNKDDSASNPIVIAKVEPVPMFQKSNSVSSNDDNSSESSKEMRSRFSSEANEINDPNQINTQDESPENMITKKVDELIISPDTGTSSTQQLINASSIRDSLSKNMQPGSEEQEPLNSFSNARSSIIFNTPSPNPLSPKMRANSNNNENENSVSSNQLVRANSNDPPNTSDPSPPSSKRTSLLSTQLLQKRGKGSTSSNYSATTGTPLVKSNSFSAVGSPNSLDSNLNTLSDIAEEPHNNSKNNSTNANANATTVSYFQSPNERRGQRTSSNNSRSPNDSSDQGLGPSVSSNGSTSLSPPSGTGKKIRKQVVLNMAANESLGADESPPYSLKGNSINSSNKESGFELHGILKSRIRLETFEEVMNRILLEREIQAQSIIILSVGTLLYKVNRNGRAENRWLFVSSDGSDLFWEKPSKSGSRPEPKKKSNFPSFKIGPWRFNEPSSKPLADLVALYYGPFASLSAFDRYLSFLDGGCGKPWLCFTVRFNDRTLDFIANNENELDIWYLGIQSLGPLSKYYTPKGRLLWYRLIMKINFYGLDIALTGKYKQREIEIMQTFKKKNNQKPKKK